MSAQNDIIAGVDLSAVSSITQEDLMQSINQAEPLDNIGLVVCSETRPDITNNPRFIRYLWIDITDPDAPTIKRYIGDRDVPLDADVSWAALTVAELAVITASFFPRSTTGGVNVGLLKLNADYSAIPASIYYILRVAANGKDIEAASLTAALTDGGGVPLGTLSTTGLAAGKFLGFNAGVAGYVPIVPSTDLVGASRIAAETNILPSSARFVLRTNAGATAPEWVTPDSQFNDNELSVQRLLATGAVANDILRFNGTIWEKISPSLRLVAGDVANQGILSANPVSTAVHTLPHGLGVVPKLVDVRMRLTGGADNGYATNDEVQICNYQAGGGSPLAAVCVDATNITIAMAAATGNLVPKGGGAAAGVTEASWFPVAYAWR